MNLIPALSSRQITKRELLSGTRKFAIVCTLLLAFSEPLANAQPGKMQQMLDRATLGSGVVALVVDAKSGRLLAVERPQDAAHLRSRPGSILKPFFLAGALEQNLLHPQTTVFCRRSLHILGRDLSCTHPQSEVAFSADDALAYSCNTYFAELANRLSPTQSTTILRSYGLGDPTHYFAAESSSNLQTPSDSEHKQLFVLGLAGVSVTPAQIAAAYLRLALKVNDVRTSPAMQAVTAGLSHSVQYGMAHSADVPGLQISGKTGTASDPGQTWTHGWFAGFATIKTETVVTVFYVPHGNGADAASIAQRFFLAMKAGQ